MSKEALGNNGSYREHLFTDIQSHEQISDELVNGILLCVPGSSMRTTDEDTLHHIQGDVVQVYTDPLTEEVFAFSSTVFGSPNEIFSTDEISDERGCYFAGATIMKDRQSTGFYKVMNEKRAGIALEQGFSLIFTRTQNPRVQSGISAVLDELTERGSIQGYDLSRVLIPGCYGSMLTEEKPTDSKVSFDELNYENGDAFVLLFDLQRNQPQ